MTAPVTTIMAPSLPLPAGAAFEQWCSLVETALGDDTPVAWGAALEHMPPMNEVLDAATAANRAARVKAMLDAVVARRAGVVHELDELNTERRNLQTRSVALTSYSTAEALTGPIEQLLQLMWVG